MAKKSATKANGPYLACAVFCDSIMEDASGKVSAIGILDGCQLYVSPDAPADFPSEANSALIAPTTLIIFRSGDSAGKHSIHFIVEHPNGEKSKLDEKVITMSEPSHGGINFKVQI